MNEKSTPFHETVLVKPPVAEGSADPNLYFVALEYVLVVVRSPVGLPLSSVTSIYHSGSPLTGSTPAHSCI